MNFKNFMNSLPEIRNSSNGACKIYNKDNDILIDLDDKSTVIFTEINGACEMCYFNNDTHCGLLDKPEWGNIVRNACVVVRKNGLGCIWVKIEK